MNFLKKWFRMDSPRAASGVDEPTRERVTATDLHARHQQVNDESEDDIIDALQAGRIGTVVNMYLVCHDLVERGTEVRQQILARAYQEMVPLCPGLMVAQSRIVVDKTENNHFIEMHIRFVHPSEATSFQDACNAILRTHGFEA